MTGGFFGIIVQYGASRNVRVPIFHGVVIEKNLLDFDGFARRRDGRGYWLGGIGPRKAMQAVLDLIDTQSFAFEADLPGAFVS